MLDKLKNEPNPYSYTNDQILETIPSIYQGLNTSYWILLVKEIYDNLYSPESVIDALMNVETATGDELTNLAEFFNLDRNSPIEKKLTNYFGYYNLGDDYSNIDGFSGYANFNDVNNGVDVSEYVSLETHEKNLYQLTDTQLRLLCKLMIIKSNYSGKFSDLVNQLANLFGNQLQVIDTQNMQLTYFLSLGNFDVKLIKFYDLLPRSLGVSTDLIIQGIQDASGFQYASIDNLDATAEKYASIDNLGDGMSYYKLYS